MRSPQAMRGIYGCGLGNADRLHGWAMRWSLKSCPGAEASERGEGEGFKVPSQRERFAQASLGLILPKSSGSVSDSAASSVDVHQFGPGIEKLEGIAGRRVIAKRSVEALHELAVLRVIDRETGAQRRT